MSDATATVPAPPVISEIENEILRQIRSLRYGAVEIQVHDTRIVQVERRERLRLDERPKTR